VTDLEILEGLNRDYISSVQNGDTKRFGEILSEDFLNTNPDGSLVDKAGFLKQFAPPVKIRGLAIDDVNIRVMGDFASSMPAPATRCSTDGRATVAILTYTRSGTVAGSASPRKSRAADTLWERRRSS
jgi:hypothetical protein